MSHLAARSVRALWLRVLVLTAWVLALAGALFGGQPVQAATSSFINPTPISAGAPGSSPPAGAASPYPSSILVSGLAGNILDVNVTLHGVDHNRPDDLDVLLVGPLGQTVILTSDACGNMSPGGADFTFDDEAAGPLPDTDGGTACVTGTYRPWNYEGGGSDTIVNDEFYAPAPGGPYGSTLSVFDGLVANGTWHLYVMDDRDGSGGGISGGWSLTIESEDVPVEPGEPAAPIITAEDVLRAQAVYCADLSGATSPIVRASIPSGTVMSGGVYCRVIAENGTFVAMHNGAAAIGNADVLAQGVIHAVDVFGMAGGTGFVAFNNPIEVCLQGSGRFLFLNAATSPRALSQLPAYSQGGYTCASIPNAGTVVLVP